MMAFSTSVVMNCSFLVFFFKYELMENRHRPRGGGGGMGSCGSETNKKTGENGRLISRVRLHFLTHAQKIKSPQKQPLH